MTTTTEEPIGAARTYRCCAACGIDTTMIRGCSRCRTVGYCGRDCQRGHWKDHKRVCDDAIEDKNLVKAAKAVSKNVKKAKKAGMPTMTISMTAFGMVGPGMPIPDGVPPNFSLKQAALLQFTTGGPSRPNELGNLQYEACYRAYYDDICESTSIWMTFFDHPYNYEHAEHTCGILGTLATVYRQRATDESNKECKAVLDMEEEVLKRYRRSSIGANRAQIHCCDAIEYKMKMIQNNLAFQLGQYETCMSLFRDLAGFEQKYNISYEEQNFLFMVEAILGKPPNAASLGALTDYEVREMVMAPLKLPTGRQRAVSEKEQQRVALLACAGCGKSESTIRSFKACARCQSVVFCGKECQRQSWKSHKKICNTNKK
uniref:MYND-type domain-containing protein n=1 Tax=Attheya septentrionalis TaxID=420275 RepID=A0A7S2UNG7_9STRA|mmetsp:Transcript_29648/g.54290  ORF Transcript_29648/g.54290 Transcript_29648/m.54290 type:complete len:373 (+) Transcript_29648:199-1317(+)